MSEEDDRAYQRRIVELLERHGFGWVVEQAEAQIAEGKSSSKQVSETEYIPPSLDTDFQVRTPRRRRASLITSEPYLESEKLQILLDGIRSAVIERADLERSVLEKLPDFKSIYFEPDIPAAETETRYFAKSHHLTSSENSVRQDIRERTQLALRKLEERSVGGS